MQFYSRLTTLRDDYPRLVIALGMFDGVHRGHRSIISRAVELAQPDDIVVILGKGHEDYQILKDKTIHFDDKEQARAAIAAKLRKEEA